MITVIFILTLLGLLFPKSRLIAWIEIIAMSLFYGGYNGHIDLNNYIWQYQNNWITDSPLQKLYSYTSVAFHCAGISFEAYHFVITVISLVIIAIIVSKMTEQTAYVLSLISIFVYIENGWQLKTMLATSVIVLALYWFYKRIYSKPYNSKSVMKDMMIYVILIFVAAQFHFLALFFLAFLFMPIVKGHFVKVIFADLMIFALANVILERAAVYIKMLNNYLSPISLPVFIVAVLWQVLGYFMLVYKSERDKLEIENDCIQGFVFDGSLVLMLIMPFYYYTTGVTRIYRIWIIFIAVYASKLSRKKFLVNIKRLILDAYVIGSSIFWFYVMFKFRGTEPLITNLIKDNFFF